MENEKTVDTLGNDDHGLCVVMISIDDLHDFRITVFVIAYFFQGTFVPWIIGNKCF